MTVGELKEALDKYEQGMDVVITTSSADESEGIHAMMLVTDTQDYSKKLVLAYENPLNW